MRRSALALSFHLSQWPVLSCCLPEGAGLDRTLERQLLLLLAQLEALVLSNPGHTFACQPEHTACARAAARPQRSPATGPVVTLAPWPPQDSPQQKQEQWHGAPAWLTELGM